MKISILGATGNTGRLLLSMTLEGGHTVRALVRDPAKVTQKNERLELIKGDVSDFSAVSAAVKGVDVVISAIGPTSDRKDICSIATSNVLAANPARYIVVSGAGTDMPGDEKDFVGKIVSSLVRLLSPAVFADKVKELALLQQSDVPWVAVRPPRLMKGTPSRPPRFDLKKSPGASITHAALAEFLLRCASDDAFLRKAPFVAG